MTENGSRLAPPQVVPQSRLIRRLQTTKGLAHAVRIIQLWCLVHGHKPKRYPNGVLINGKSYGHQSLRATGTVFLACEYCGEPLGFLPVTPDDIRALIVEELGERFPVNK